MKKFIAVVTSMAMAASLLTACGSNAASTETTTAAASEAASEKETAGKEAEETEPGAKTDGAASVPSNVAFEKHDFCPCHVVVFLFKLYGRRNYFTLYIGIKYRASLSLNAKIDNSDD